MPKRVPTLKTPKIRHPDCARLSPCKRGYDRDWRRVRLWHLSQHPLCADCEGRGLTTAATEVDHVLALERGGTHDADNLMSLCKPCHSRKTVRVDGGLGTQRT
jgi:5-methylcytosine-specific restriction protein A